MSERVVLHERNSKNSMMPPPEERKPIKYKIEDFNKMEKIGEGTYGVVYKAENTVTKEIVAMKRIRVESEEEGIPSTALRECSILKEASRHANIVKLLQIIQQDEKRLYLIFEFLSMDLKKYLDTHDGLLSEQLLKNFLFQMTNAILFCHKRRILHRDLKPQNILVQVTANITVVKIADFGLGRTFGIPIRAFTHEVVTLWYRAPEVLLGAHRYGCPLDMWSIGCIFSEMATKKPLFQGDSEIDQLFRIFRVLTTPNEQTWPKVTTLPDYKQSFPNWTKDSLEEQVTNMSKDGMQLLRAMLIYDPDKRIIALDALQHEYFNDLDYSLLPTLDN